MDLDASRLLRMARAARRGLLQRTRSRVAAGATIVVGVALFWVATREDRSVAPATGPATRVEAAAPAPRVPRLPESVHWADSSPWPAPSAPRSPARARAPVRLDIDAFNARVPLADLMTAAAASSDPDYNSLAWRALLMCSTVSHVDANPPAAGEADQRQAFRYLVSPPAIADAVYDEAMRARAVMRGYCAASGLADWFPLLKNPPFTHATALALAPGMRGLPEPDSPWREASLQRLQQLLANPAKYPVALNGWLSWGMHRDVPGLVGTEVQVVRDLLFHELTGARPDPMSLRALERCGLEYWCPAQIAAVEPARREQALAVGRRMLGLIQQQRIDELLAPSR